MSLESVCTSATFSSLPVPFGTEIRSVEASIGTFNATLPTYTFTQPTRHLEFSFCNATVGYTHPGQGDTIYVEIWLPAPDAWNRRLLGVGGGGFASGRFDNAYNTLMAPAVADGYAAVTTDSGVSDIFGTWGLLGQGNLNLVNIDNFGGRALEEQGLLGKSLTTLFYGEGPAHSYFSGCSQGGRQAITIAQRYPTLYDGIFANAPGLSMSRVIPSLHWPQQFMLSTGQVPRACELDGVTAAAIAACDGLDGVTDGIVAEAEACLGTFNPFSVVGQEAACADIEGGSLVVGRAAAAVANATWHGMTTAFGQRIWPGYTPSSDLTGNRARNSAPGAGIANTVCDGDAEDACVGSPYPLTPIFIRHFLARDVDLDVASLTHEQFDELVRTGLHSLRAMDSLDLDLGAFARAGGRMITYHGMDDQIVPLGGTTEYYDRLLASSPSYGYPDGAGEVQDFYRLFAVPGLMHCFGGNGGYPTALLGQLTAWVENGTAPEESTYEVVVPDPGNSTAGAEKIEQRLLCPYPQKAVWTGQGWACH